MAVFSESEILTLMRIQNPWWETGKPDERREVPFRRGEFFLCAQTFWHVLRRFPVLSGPRRVGKSTIVFQMIGDLIRSGVDAHRILYMSMDTVAMEEAGIIKLLMLYRSQVSQTEEFYLFVDEVQKDEDWTSALKFVYDSFPEARAMATGSASFKIEGKTRETGEGRLRLIRIPTLSFYEFCCLRKQDAEVPELDSLFRLHTKTLEEQSGILLPISRLEPEMNRYLRTGGFPEYVSLPPQGEAYALSLIEENVINKVIFTDLTQSDRVNPSQLKRLFSYLCNVTSNMINVEEICRELRGMANITANKYMDILESAGLIYCAEQIDSTGKKVLKTRRKVHIADSGIREAMVSGLHTPDDPVQRGYLIESMAYKHTIDYCRCAGPFEKVGYMNQAGSDKEIDIVICDRSGIVQLVESKIREHSVIRENDLILTAGLPDRPGYVITKASGDYGYTQRKNGSLYRIPAVAYLYLMGRMKYRRNQAAFSRAAGEENE